jgi:hypothetical protein
MDAFDEPVEEIARGLSRRQFLCRVGGSLAGAMLASVWLEVGGSYGAAPGSMSLRDLLSRISAQGCGPSHGIRALLPNDHPVISIRAVARRYAGSVVNFCKPLQISIQQKEVAGGGVTVYLSGVNFTGGGMAAIQYRSDISRDDLDFSVQVQPDGTFAHVINLGCSAPGLALYSLEATDAATGRRTDAISGEYTCPQPQMTPPPKPPSITVSRQGATFTVAGTGFLAKHLIVIRVVDPATFASNYYNSTSDAAGKLNFPVSPPCPSSRQLAFSASDSRSVPTSQDHTGMLWSNTVTVACS